MILWDVPGYQVAVRNIIRWGGGMDVRGGREDSGIDQVGVYHGVLTNDPPNCVFRNNVGIVSAVFASISDQPGSLRSMLF